MLYEITTLLNLLYPPLKGFSHSLDTHTRCESILFQSSSKGISSPKAFDIEVFRDLLIKLIKIGKWLC